MVLAEKRTAMEIVASEEVEANVDYSTGGGVGGISSDGLGGELSMSLRQFPILKPRAAMYELNLPPFLSKTFEMVSDPNTDQIISWGQTGTSFIVWDHIMFSADILPFYFRHNNFSSFLYQLNTHGFRKIGWQYRWEYEHQWFQAGRMDLLKNIKRRDQLPENKRQNRRRKPCYDYSVKIKVEAMLKKVRSEQNQLKEEILKLKHQQEKMQNQCLKLIESIANIDIKGEKILSSMASKFSPTLLQHVIKQLKQKTELDGMEATKKRRLEVVENILSPVETFNKVDAIATSRRTNGKNQVGERFITIQPESETIIPASDSTCCIQDTMPSDNVSFWKKVMEDISMCEDEGKEGLEQDEDKIVMELEEDLIASDIAKGSREFDGKAKQQFPCGG